MGSLSDIRVVDFGSEIGSYAGKLYADLGAEVIHIEFPEGDPLRLEWPFYKDRKNDREAGLTYLYHNTGKRSLVLDIRREEGKDVFLKLIKTSSILIETFPPGYLESYGMGYEKLKKQNPKIVHTSITPFGQDGPYSKYPASDLTLLALGGFLHLMGEGKDKPSRVYGNQAYMMAMLYAAIGSMAAFYGAEQTGEGQFVDVSIQACVATALENSPQYWDLEKIVRRSAFSLEAGYGTYKCKDGYVFAMFGLGGNTKLWDPLPKWLKDEGAEGADILGEEKWRTPQYRSTEEAKKIFKEIFERFAMKREKLYLYEESQRRECVCYPVSDPKDVLENPQLKYKKFFKTLYHETLNGEVVYPGEPYYLEKIPWQLKPAPRFAQHTQEILRDLGYHDNQINDLKERGVIVVGQ